MPSYKFSYFDLRGRGEPSRMLFAAAGIPFTDKRVTQEEFGKMKATDPYASLPILEVTAGNDAYMMNQSMAINRHLARTFGLDGVTLNDKGMVDEIIENLVDVKSALFAVGFGDTEENREKLGKTLNKMCPKLEAQIQSNMKKGAGFAVGPKLTFADIFIFEAFESILSKMPDALNSYPGIKQNREKVAKLPKVADYVKKRKETPF
ncbi:hypothetical protein FSP39_022582 [Pinctada imbricata]|uniref:Glutathione S-transferase n=1 Tax=Pinctada imbricata TaxID=66713 RepID=A0AA89C7D5_PINIB|nr:hypothetical protein FSP39_022582 [Pinctada imbricata]